MKKILIFLIFPILVHGQANQDTFPKIKIDRAYIKSYFIDTKDIVVSPFHWNKKQWITTAGILGATVLTYTQDASVRDIFQNNRNNTTDNIAKYGLEPIGSGKYTGPLLLAFYGYGAIFHDERSKETGLLGAKTFLVTAFVGAGIKQIFHRERPFQTDHSPDNINGPIGKAEYTSFPSGHTTVAFSVATIFANEYKDKKAVPIIAYTLAGLTGLSRINDDKHWASDVFMGAAYGWAMGKLIYTADNWMHRTSKVRK